MVPVNKTAVRRKQPEWLGPRWEKKKQITATRVDEAVQALKRDGDVVSYASIRERVHSLSGVWISANTIKRNDLAYQIYLANRRPPRIPCLPNHFLRDWLRVCQRRSVGVFSPRFHACAVSPRTC